MKFQNLFRLENLKKNMKSIHEEKKRKHNNQPRIQITRQQQTRDNTLV